MLVIEAVIFLEQTAFKQLFNRFVNRYNGDAAAVIADGFS